MISDRSNLIIDRCVYSENFSESRKSLSLSQKPLTNCAFRKPFKQFSMTSAIQNVLCTSLWLLLVRYFVEFHNNIIDIGSVLSGDECTLKLKDSCENKRIKRKILLSESVLKGLYCIMMYQSNSLFDFTVK